MRAPRVSASGRQRPGWWLALFFGFFRREFVARYAGTVFGSLWVLVQPLLMLAVYAFVFQRVFKVALPDLGGASFVAFVAAALWPWLAFQEGVMRGTQAIMANRDLVRKVSFPYEVLVVAVVAAAFVLHFAGFVAVLALLAALGEPVRAAGLGVVVWVWLLLLGLACGLALALSAAQVVVKDIDHMLAPLFMLGFYLTPILYPLDLVPEPIRAWMIFNPLVHLVGPLREALILGAAAALPGLLLASAAVGLLIIAGLAFFRRLSGRFEDFF